MYESVVSEAGFADRLPGPVRRVWDALGALPEGREPDERVFFVAARIKQTYYSTHCRFLTLIH